MTSSHELRLSASNPFPNTDVASDVSLGSGYIRVQPLHDSTTDDCLYFSAPSLRPNLEPSHDHRVEGHAAFPNDAIPLLLASISPDPTDPLSDRVHEEERDDLGQRMAHQQSKEDGEGSDNGQSAKEQLPNDRTPCYGGLVPITPPDGYPRLDFRPTFLKRSVTITLALLYISIVGGLQVLLWQSGDDRRLQTTNADAYFIARYLPTIVGTMSVTMFRSMLKDFRRMLPYIAMADQGDQITQGAPAALSIAATYPLYVPLSLRRNTWLTIATFLASWTAGVVVPFKSALLNADLAPDQHWTLSVHVIPAYMLMGVFTMMAMFTIVVTIVLWSADTGLKSDWDPNSLADMLALFSYCDLSSLECHTSTAAYNCISRAARFRLGYWRIEASSKQSLGTGYGIAQLDPEVPLQLFPDSPLTDSDAMSQVHNMAESETVRGYQRIDRLDKRQEFHCQPQTARELHRYSVILWPLDITFWTLGVLAGLLVAVLMLQNNHVRQQWSLPNTWWRHMPGAEHNATKAAASNSSDSWWDDPSFAADPAHDRILYVLVFTSIPVLSAGLFGAFYLSAADLHFRYTQPFANLNTGPSAPEQSLFLDYINGSALKVPLEAFENKHWKVFWYSILASIGRPLFPIVVGGLFVITNTEDRIVFETSQAAFGATFAFLVIFAVSVPLSWPTRKRRLPRKMLTMLDPVVVFGPSRMRMDDEYFKNSPWWTKNMFYADIMRRREKYELGIIQTEEGKWRIGIDAVESPGRSGRPMEKPWKPPPLRLWRNCTSLWRRFRRMTKSKGDDDIPLVW